MLLRSMRFLPMFFLPVFLSLFAACDTGTSAEPPEPVAPSAAEGTFSALLNGEAYQTPSELLIDKEYDQTRILSINSDLNSYFYRSIHITQGVSVLYEGQSFEILNHHIRTDNGQRTRNSASASENDGDALIMHFQILESEPRELVVEEVDEEANYYRARFRATFVAEQLGYADSPLRQWPDTLRFTEGVFEGQLRPEDE